MGASEAPDPSDVRRQHLATANPPLSTILRNIEGGENRPETWINGASVVFIRAADEHIRAPVVLIRAAVVPIRAAVGENLRGVELIRAADEHIRALAG